MTSFLHRKQLKDKAKAARIASRSSSTPQQVQSDRDWLWKPGTSGNPSGRPKGISLTNRLVRHMDTPCTDPAYSGLTWGEAIVRAHCAGALALHPVCVGVVWDRIDGKAKQSLALEGELTLNEQKQARERLRALLAGLAAGRGADTDVSTDDDRRSDDALLDTCASDAQRKPS